MGDAADDLEHWQDMAELDRAMGWDDDQGSECPACKGKGTVNPLTAPDDFFCIAQTDCPLCDGDGEI